MRGESGRALWRDCRDVTGGTNRNEGGAEPGHTRWCDKRSDKRPETIGGRVGHVR